jgi:repressor LexA
MPTMVLTRRQREIYEHIRSCIARRGYAPALEEIAARFGLASVATVHKHLAALEAKGVVRREKHRSRAIELTGQGDSVPAFRLPVLGAVAAGTPIEAVEDAQEVVVSSEFVGRGETFVLRVRGDSMIGEQIRDGDLIVVERRRTAENGQTVVALIDGTETTVKRFYAERGRVRLQPANDAMPAMVFPSKRVEIQGVVIGLLRKYPA